MRRRWDVPEAGKWRRHLLGAPLLTLTTLACASLVLTGARWRAESTVAAAPAVQAEPVEGSVTVPASVASEQAEPGAESAKPSAPAAPPSTATDEELAQAIAQGVDGLLPLSEKHPRDPRVLKPLVLAFASRATGLADAMVTIRRLLEVAPEEVADEDLRYLVKRGAQTPGETAKLAFELMTEHMGTAGPDLLYELLHLNKMRPEAEKWLASPEVRAKSSPALRIAYDLRKAASCADRVPLLERASQLGDERSIAILSPLSTGSKTGCGKWKRSPCQPACAKEASLYLKAISDISKRINKPQR